VKTANKSRRVEGATPPGAIHDIGHRRITATLCARQVTSSAHHRPRIILQHHYHVDDWHCHAVSRITPYASSRLLAV